MTLLDRLLEVQKRQKEQVADLKAKAAKVTMTLQVLCCQPNHAHTRTEPIG